MYSDCNCIMSNDGKDSAEALNVRKALDGVIRAEKEEQFNNNHINFGASSTRLDEAQKEWLDVLEEFARVPDATETLAKILEDSFSDLGNSQDLAKSMLEEVEQQQPPQSTQQEEAITNDEQEQEDSIKQPQQVKVTKCNVSCCEYDNELNVVDDDCKITSKDNSRNCCVCLENFSSDEVDEKSSCKKLSCGHTFHKSCIDGWLNKHSTTCPVCRHDVATDEQYQYHYYI